YEVGGEGGYGGGEVDGGRGGGGGDGLWTLDNLTNGVDMLSLEREGRTPGGKEGGRQAAASALAPPALWMEGGPESSLGGGYAYGLGGGEHARTAARLLELSRHGACGRVFGLPELPFFSFFPPSSPFPAHVDRAALCRFLRRHLPRPFLPLLLLLHLFGPGALVLRHGHSLLRRDQQTSPLDQKLALPPVLPPFLGRVLVGGLGGERGGGREGGRAGGRGLGAEREVGEGG
ncbi:hypothetical protein Naga_101499g1, partial [Nannochloropsis gaditana]